MASTSISAVTTLISGVEAVTGTISASGETCTITGPSGGPLDFSTLSIRIDSTNTAVSSSTVIAASSSYSSLDQGTASITIATGTTVYIGGEDFESARFKQVSAQSVILTFAGASCGAVIEASQAPYSVTG